MLGWVRELVDQRPRVIGKQGRGVGNGPWGRQGVSLVWAQFPATDKFLSLTHRVTLANPASPSLPWVTHSRPQTGTPAEHWHPGAGLAHCAE